MDVIEQKAGAPVPPQIPGHAIPVGGMADDQRVAVGVIANHDRKMHHPPAFEIPDEIAGADLRELLGFCGQ